MRFIKAVHCSVMCAALLAGCGKTPVKPAEPIADQAPVIRTFDFEAVQKRPIKREEFGPNPNLQAGHAVPEAAVAEYRFALEAVRGGNQDLAEQQFKEMLDKYPELSGPAYNLAVLKKQQGDVEQANQYLDMALTRNYANFDARNMKALILREQGEFDQAEQVYLDIIRSWGGYAPAYRNIGILYDLYLGRTAEALVYYRQYNYMLDEPEPQVTGWIVDIERRLGIPPLSFDEPVEEEVPVEAVDDMTDSPVEADVTEESAGNEEVSVDENNE